MKRNILSRLKPYEIIRTSKHLKYNWTEIIYATSLPEVLITSPFKAYEITRTNSNFTNSYWTRVKQANSLQDAIADSLSRYLPSHLGLTIEKITKINNEGCFRVDYLYGSKSGKIYYKCKQL